MKKIVFLLLAGTLSLLSSCKGDKDELPVIDVDGATIVEIDSKAQDVKVKVSSNLTLSTSITYPNAAPGDRQWLTKKPGTKAVSSDELVYAAEESKSGSPREALITITDGSKTKKVLVRQANPKSALYVEFQDSWVEQVTDFDTGIITVTIGEFGTDTRFGSDMLRAYVETTAHFKAVPDKSCESWVKIASGENVSPVLIRVDAARANDPYDYSNNRLGSVRIFTEDGEAEQIIIINQKPRTRGLYVIDKEGQLADEMAKEDKSFPYTSDTLRVISVEKIDEVIQPAPLNNDDLLAIKKYFINVKVVDLSAAVFDTIPDNCFKIEALKTVILPEEGIKVIGSEAFYPLVSSSFALTHIGPPSAIVTTDNDGKPVLTKPKTYIPDGVEIIGSKAFYYALGEEIRIPSSVASIGTHAFYFHKATSIVFANPENENIDNPVSIEGAPISKMSIATNAFKGHSSCRYQSDLFIPNYVLEIGTEAFATLGNTTPSATFLADFTLTIGKNITLIDNKAFSSNRCFDEILFVDPNATAPGLTIGSSTTGGASDGVFNQCAFANFQLPKRTIKLGAGAVSGCSALTELSLPEGLTYIGNAAFSGTSSYKMNLRKLRIPSTVTEIGNDVMLLWMYPAPEEYKIYIPATDMSDFTDRVKVGANAWRYNSSSGGVQYNTPSSPAMSFSFFTPGGAGDPGI